jgi:hypothetical protein
VIFTTAVYPNLSFYIKTKDEEFADRGGLKMFFFQNGIFDTDDCSEDEKLLAEAALEKLATTLGASGVQKYEEKDLPFKCPICSRGFASQAAVQGHSRMHKSNAEIVSESIREGSVVPGNVVT